MFSHINKTKVMFSHINNTKVIFSHIDNTVIWTQSLVRAVQYPTARLRDLFLQVISLTYRAAP